MIPYGRQNINDQDIAAVCDALKQDLLTTGPIVSNFENAIASLLGAKHAIAVSNATAALHIAMLAAEVGKGDRVVTSPITFVASANCAAYVGATPAFADIDPISYCLSAESLEANWTSDTKAVVAVDYAGQTADMPAIAEIAHRNQAWVIEDASHAIGGAFEFQGKEWKIGAHPWADMTVFSFHPVKTLTTGEGGLLVTSNDQLANRARMLRAHGIQRDRQKFEGLGDQAFEEKGPWYYEQQDLGFNYRITDFQCALGLSQLRRLPQFLERRREIASIYNSAFSELKNVHIPKLRNESDKSITSWHLYTLQIEFSALGFTRTQLMEKLSASGVGSQVLYIPVHLQPWYRRTYGYGFGNCPNAEQFYLRTLSLPLHPSMTDDDVQRVIDVFKKEVS